MKRFYDVRIAIVVRMYDLGMGVAAAAAGRRPEPLRRGHAIPSAHCSGLPLQLAGSSYRLAHSGQEGLLLR